MQPNDRRVPRPLLCRTVITIEVTPAELHKLIRALEDDAYAAIERGQDDFADCVLRCVSELREAGP
jgi:hypothetical protein